MPPSIATVPLTHCPECGYNLHGLPPHGRCPECGFPYDHQLLVIFGFVHGKDENLLNASPTRVRSQLVANAFFIALLIFYAIAARTFIPALIALALIAIFARQLLQRRQTPLPKPAQMRFTPEGFAKRVGVGPVTLIPWHKNYRISITNMGRGRWLLRVRLAPFTLNITDPSSALQLETSLETIQSIAATLRTFTQPHHIKVDLTTQPPSIWRREF